MTCWRVNSDPTWVPSSGNAFICIQGHYICLFNTLSLMWETLNFFYKVVNIYPCSGESPTLPIREEKMGNAILRFRGVCQSTFVTIYRHLQHVFFCTIILSLELCTFDTGKQCKRKKGRSDASIVGRSGRVGHLFFSIERNVLTFFCILFKTTKHSLRSFTFFIKERGVLCVLLRSL